MSECNLANHTHAELVVPDHEGVLFCFRISLSKDDDIIIEGGNLDFEEQAQLDIKCLQILRATIYNKIILINEEDKERNPKKYRR